MTNYTECKGIVMNSPSNLESPKETCPKYIACILEPVLKKSKKKIKDHYKVLKSNGKRHWCVCDSQMVMSPQIGLSHIDYE